MLKNALKIAMTFGLLVAGYLGYERAFAFASGFSRPPRLSRVIPASDLVTQSDTSKLADEIAARAFGPDHWTAHHRNSTRWYNPGQNYVIYFKDFQRLRSGEEMKLAPFIVIWVSKDGKSLKSLRSERATVRFDKALDVTNPGAVGQVSWAQAVDDVWIVDDKGTATKEDDLKIGPLTHLDFEAKRDRITSGSAVHMVDRNMDLTSVGVAIDLRPSGAKTAGGSGYAGARTITFLRNVKVDVADVGKSGVVPGTGPVAAADPKAPRKPKPGRATSAGPLRIDVPPPRIIPDVGPPMPSEPTLAHFEQQVTVMQGDPTDNPDRIDGDHLYLTLVPALELPTTPEASRLKREAKAALKEQAEVEGTEEEATGPVSELSLVTARATGHAVFLTSPGRGIKGVGEELMYKRNAPIADDLIYFSGSRQTDLERTNYVVGKDKVPRVESVDRLRAKDLNIFQRPDGQANVVARGPGRMETRASKDDSIARTAVFTEEMQVVNLKMADGTPRRRLTLKGKPSVDSAAQGRLSARDQIIALLKPKPRPEGEAAKEGQDEFTIENVDALVDVDLETARLAPRPGKPAPGRRHVHARDRLHAEFEQAAATTDPKPDAEPKPATAAEPPKAAEPAAEAAPVPPPEPDTEVEADEVWTWITQPAEPGGKAELREARLRGKVALDQAPAAGKPAGFHIAADKVDMLSQGEGRMYATAIGTPTEFASASTPEMTITGLKLRVDQRADRMWSPGPGTLTQHPKPPEEEPKVAAKKGKKGPTGPVVIRWAESMDFLGSPLDADGVPAPARATFLGKVKATADESVLNAGKMVATMDRPVPFTRAPKEPGKKDDEPKPQIVEIHSTKDVVVVNREMFDDRKALKAKQRVEGQDVRYHRPTGHFEVVGAGLVDYYARGLPEDAEGPLARKPPTTVPVAAKPKEKVKPKAAAPALKPLELTRIKFGRGMKGQITADEEPDQSREADFDGGSEVLRAIVADEDATLDRDALPKRGDYMIMTSRKLHVSSVPLPSKATDAKDAPKAKTLLDAQGEAHVDTRDKAIAGDRITYDSATGLSFVYGHENPVTIAQQGGIGQPSAFASGSVVRFNHRTRDTQLIDPRSLQFVDGRGATRTYPSQPAPDVKETKPKRNFRPNIPGDKEKRSFTGK